ncbi:MAG: sulfatase-like hydrolase/transferase [Legionella sp.]
MRRIICVKQWPQEKPNILLIITDEKKALSGYEGLGVRKFHDEVLLGQRELKENGITIIGHHTSSNACYPSRAIIATGQYPSLTGVTQTDGITMSADDPEIRDLPTEVPTSGSYFQAAGYEVKYVGKWHVSHGADIVHAKGDGTADAPLSKPVNQPPDEQVEAAYLAANTLQAYGYKGWVGPDPHGSSPHNAAFNRDSDYARQLNGWLRARAAKGDKTPFFAVASLVDPHDIVYFPFYWLYLVYKYGFPMPGPEVNSIPILLPPTIGDSLDDKPSIQKSTKNSTT